ncbi:Succinyl-CoA ligase [ADP-forming] subunit beta [Adhaeretor mobilis]|uniref:Succinate--CoA ligase [ADP-forming] subunit beta n=2 Tax=Adhaeretor mobilis TaxID=1930276 RepID=A0A517MVW2_9BACT|nr:Succinyl-CoA ligase [ADP-forming] subunit beta [Adhaeretor mobilis]
MGCVSFRLLYFLAFFAHLAVQKTVRLALYSTKSPAGLFITSANTMKIHEYQAKELFRNAGIAVPEGHVATTPEEAAAAYKQLGGEIAVVKAQIHAGGRGKGTIKTNRDQRGVQLVRSAEEASSVAEALLGKELETIQTGPAGKKVKQVFVEAGCDIDRELYLGIVVDRASGLPVLMTSEEGGVNIEEVAEKTPELIFKEAFHPDQGLQKEQVESLCKKLNITGDSVASANDLMTKLCKLFVELDCSIAEINPLVVTKSGQVMALDAKVNFDDNALFRHKELLELRDLDEEDPAEVRAGKAGLSYVQLEGNIGCLVNGAGLAMSTMDLIKLHGGEPANFLDVGGGAQTEQVTEAFRILLGDKNVKAVLVNIFGGIMQCTTIANAVLEAYKQVGFNVPLVVRLEGTEVEEGRKILAESDVDIITAEGLTDAAEKVVAAANAA